MNDTIEPGKEGAMDVPVHALTAKSLILLVDAEL
jgi:hypothetical protein